MIVEGESYRDISAHFEVSLATLASWIEENPERSRVCARAREISAQTFDEQALEVVRGATDMFALAKAKEEAIHLRWRAKAANPRRYGEKMALGGADAINYTLLKDTGSTTARPRARQLGADLGKDAGMTRAPEVDQGHSQTPNPVRPPQTMRIADTPHTCLLLGKEEAEAEAPAVINEAMCYSRPCSAKEYGIPWPTMM